MARILSSFKDCRVEVETERDDVEDVLSGMCTLLYAVELHNHWDEFAVLMNEVALTLRELAIMETEEREGKSVK